MKKTSADFFKIIFFRKSGRNGRIMKRRVMEKALKTIERETAIGVNRAGKKKRKYKTKNPISPFLLQRLYRVFG